ncbi:MAG TPA: hypothetical protein VGK37_13630 [Casimicrobiaceae bacterium]|jgi:membrane protein implicated in regulation of membrane protease activity
MKVQFEFTPADLAEVARRAVNRSPLVHRWRLRNGIVAAVLVGLLVLLATPWELTIRSIVGSVIAVVVFVIVFYLGRRRGGNTRVQEFYRERLGGDGPFTCEVELTSAGVVSRQLGQETLHPWSQVASATEISGGVEFIYRPIGSLLVRDRAFPDPQVRADFLSHARSLIPAAPLPEAAQQEAAPKAMPEEPFVAGPTESDYFVAWLLFFVCASVSANLASTVIGAGTAAILRMPGLTPMPGVYVIAGISFLLGACLSYLFFRLFTKRLVSRVQAQRSLHAA